MYITNEYLSIWSNKNSNIKNKNLYMCYLTRLTNLFCKVKRKVVEGIGVTKQKIVIIETKNSYKHSVYENRWMIFRPLWFFLILLSCMLVYWKHQENVLYILCMELEPYSCTDVNLITQYENVINICEPNSCKKKLCK